MFVVGVVVMLQYTSFYDHTYNPTQDSLTWRLDYDKKSDFDDCFPRQSQLQQEVCERDLLLPQRLPDHSEHVESNEQQLEEQR